VVDIKATYFYFANKEMANLVACASIYKRKTYIAYYNIIIIIFIS